MMICVEGFFVTNYDTNFVAQNTIIVIIITYTADIKCS